MPEARHRDRLPQLAAERPFLSDGGLETTLIFRRGIDLPLFAAFDLLRAEAGRAALRDYYRPYMALARERGAGFVLDTPTWRASPDWGRRLGYSAGDLDAANRAAVDLVAGLRDRAADGPAPVVVSGVLGPRGDGYVAGRRMSPDQARRYHAQQIGGFSRTAADMVSAFTLTYADEAIGIVRAAQDAGMPVTVSFTVETDGRLPGGEALREAVERTDEETGGGAAYLMVNCAHPTHIAGALAEGGAWLERIGGVRPNASTRSHAELDEATELDEGDPADLGARCRALRPRLPGVRVLGGCCGTDERHVAAIARAWLG